VADAGVGEAETGVVEAEKCAKILDRSNVARTSSTDSIVLLPAAAMIGSKSLTAAEGI
jgi:hypothetical protein